MFIYYLITFFFHKKNKSLDNLYEKKRSQALNLIWEIIVSSEHLSKEMYKSMLPYQLFQVQKNEMKNDSFYLSPSLALLLWVRKLNVNKRNLSPLALVLIIHLDFDFEKKKNKKKSHLENEKEKKNKKWKKCLKTTSNVKTLLFENLGPWSSLQLVVYFFFILIANLLQSCSCLTRTR